MVHVQSTRRPDLAFCGVTIQGPGILSVRLGALDEAALWKAGSSGLVPVVHVTAADARSIVHGEARHTVPLHQPCVLNLGKFLGRLTGAADDLLLASIGLPSVAALEDD